MKKFDRRNAGSKIVLALLAIVFLLMLFSPAVLAQMLGDVNNDGNIDIRDVTLVQRHVLGYQPPLTASQFTAADVNGDGVVNVVDVNLMMQYILGNISSFPTHHLQAPVLTSPANNSAISGSSVLFRWNAVSGATKYQLEVLRGTESVPFKDVTVGNITMSEQFGFLRDGTQYRWRVRAGNNTGWGAWSGYFTLTSGSLPVAPTLSSPANEAIVPGYQISFQWNSVTGANKYELEVVDKSNSAFAVKAVLGDITSSLQRGFPDDASSYKWRVRAGSAEGWGPWSDYRHFINGNPPTGPVLTYPGNNVNITGDRVTFEWNPVPGADRYELLVEYVTPGGAVFKRVNVGNAFAYRVTEFPDDGSQFRWSVRAGNANGWGAFTTPYRTFINGSPFSSPVLQTPAAYSTQSGTSITFSWDSVVKATRYNLEIVDVRTGVVKNNEFPTTNSAAITGFPDNGSEFKWRVRAGDNTNWGAWSAYRYFINETITANTPTAPSLLSPAINATAATETIEFSWTASAGAANYQLQVVRVSGGAIVVDEAFGGIVTASSQSGFPNDGSEYLWRVRAENATGWGPWSFYRKFTNGTWWNFSF